MDAITILVFGLFLLVVLYKNWIPGLQEWVHDRMHSK